MYCALKWLKYAVLFVSRRNQLDLLFTINVDIFQLEMLQYVCYERSNMTPIKHTLPCGTVVYWAAQPSWFKKLEIVVQRWSVTLILNQIAIIISVKNNHTIGLLWLYQSTVFVTSTARLRKKWSIHLNFFCSVFSLFSSVCMNMSCDLKPVLKYALIYGTRTRCMFQQPEDTRTC